MQERKYLTIEKDAKQSGKSISSILPQWLIRFCQPSRMFWLAPLIGFTLCAPSFFMGYQCDDHLLIQNTIGRTIYQQRPIWDYFNWVSTNQEMASYRERGIFAWWLPNDFRFHLFHPIASLVHAFQFRFIANAPWLMHIGLALLYALLIFLCAKVLSRFSLSSTALGIGILLFAVDDTHAYSSGWISSYNTMLCCVFGLVALLMHDRWRRQKSTIGLLFAIVAFLLSLLSSEGGLALMGYLIAYALFVETGTWRKKAATLIPSSVIVISYLLFYSMQQLGAKGSIGYLSPTDDLWRTTFIVLSNAIMLVESQVISLPSFSAILQMTGAQGVVVAVILFIIILYILRAFLFSNKTVAFFGIGMVLSVVPFTMGMPGDRLLLWAGLGASGLLGELFAIEAARIGKLQRIFARTLLVSNTILSLLFFIPTLFFTLLLEIPSKALERNITSENTVFLNSAGELYSLYAPAIRYEKGGEWPEHFYSLFGGTDALTVKRTGERTLLTSTSSKGWFSSEWERLKRPKQLYFKQNDTIDMQLMTAVFEKVTADGRPISVSFNFKRDLSEFRWMKSTKNGPEKCELPPVGEEMQLVLPMF